MANNDPIVDMSPGKAWFQGNAPKVQGFKPAECPHGFLRFLQEHNRTDRSYICTECDLILIAKLPEADEE